MINEVMDHIFHNAATAAKDGQPFNVKHFKTLTVDIDGTVTSGTVTFKGKGAGGIYREIKGLKLYDWSSGTSTAITTTAAETWQFDITGLVSVIMDITALTPGVGGSLTVKGRAVS